MNSFSKNIFFKIGILLISLIILIMFLSPFLFMVGASLRLDKFIFSSIRPLSLRTFFPKIENITLENFYGIFNMMNFGRPLLNSVVVGIAMTIGVLFLNSLAAFGFSRIEFPKKNMLFFLLISTMLLPVEVSMVPMYNVVRKIGFHNTYFALIIPWLGQPFALFMLKQFFDGIPKTLDDAALIDGCTLLDIYRHIVIPNSKPALITLGLMQFLMSWDGFFWPLIAVEDESLHVVQLAVATMLDPEYIRWGWTFAAATVASVPILILFLILQRYYIQGITQSGIKG